MELIKRGRAICSYTCGERLPRVVVDDGQYSKSGEASSTSSRRTPRKIDAVENPPRRTTMTTDDARRRLGRNLHDLISLRLTPPARLSTTSPLSSPLLPLTARSHSRFLCVPCGALITHRDDPFYYGPSASRTHARASFLYAARTDTRARARARADKQAAPSSALRTISLMPGTLCREICNLSI